MIRSLKRITQLGREQLQLTKNQPSAQQQQQGLVIAGILSTLVLGAMLGTGAMKAFGKLEARRFESKLKEELKAQESNLDSSQRAALDAESQAVEARMQIEQLTREKQDALAQLGRLQRRVEAQAVAASKSVGELRAELAKGEIREALIAEKMSETETSLRRAQSDAQQVRRRVGELDGQLEAASEANRSLKQINESQRARIQSAQGEREKIAMELQAAKVNAGRMGFEMEAVPGELSLQMSSLEAEARLSELQKQNEVLLGELQKSRTRAKALQSRGFVGASTRSRGCKTRSFLAWVSSWRPLVSKLKGPGKLRGSRQKIVALRESVASHQKASHKELRKKGCRLGQAGLRGRGGESKSPSADFHSSRPISQDKNTRVEIKASTREDPARGTGCFESQLGVTSRNGTGEAKSRCC